jgi:tRNA (guanosine-2'-O-)-methyltransferase
VTDRARRSRRPDAAGAALVKPLNPTGLKRLHRAWRRQTTGRVALILDGVQNPFNVGSIIRHAAAYKVERAWLVGAANALEHPRLHKTAMGTDRFVDWRVVPTAAEAIQAATEAGFRPIGIELTPTAEPLFAVDLTGDVALVVGHEERGLSKTTLEACHGFAFAPQLGKVGSLNVAAATAIALYEVRRQEWTANVPLRTTADAETLAPPNTEFGEAVGHGHEGGESDAAAPTP